TAGDQTYGGSWMRKLFVGGLAALAVTGGSVAVAVVDPMGLAGAAQEDDTPSEAPDAGDSGEPELRGPHGGLLHEALDGLVDDGVLTEEQADAVVERLRELARDKRSERFW